MAHQTIDGIVTYLAHGVSGIVEVEGDVVFKRPWPNNPDSLTELKIEVRIYQHLGPHPRVVPFLSWDLEKSILRTRYMQNGNLRQFLSTGQHSTEGKVRWVKQAADAIKVSLT